MNQQYQTNPGRGGRTYQRAACRLLGGAAWAVATVLAAGADWSYPAARQDDVIDTFFGAEVADPYRWLEDAESPETLAWVTAQNERTRRYLDSPLRRQVAQRLTALWNYPRYSAPYRRGGRYFFWKNDGLQNQAVLYMQESLASPPREVINPNRFSADGTVAIATSQLSRDGRLLAYGLSAGGSDWQEVRIRRVDSGREYPEILRWCKFTSIAWAPDGAGFFYDRFPEPNSVPPEDRNNYNRVYWHALGTDPGRDRLVYERPDQKEWGFSPFLTEDGQFLLLHIYHGTETRNRIYYRPVDASGPFVRLLDAADARYEFIGNIDSLFFFQTDRDAPRGRIIAIDLNRPAPQDWLDILPQQEQVMDFTALINRRLVVGWMQDVQHRLGVYRWDGTFIRDIPLPAPGTVAGLSGKATDTEMFFTFTSFLYPPTIYRYDFLDESLTVFRRPEVDFDPAPYRTHQVFYTSKDGTRVPMFLTHGRDLPLDGSHPVLLTGYGGFNISRRPYFSVSHALWLQRGGVLALANLRGGGEYGEQWHRAGMLDKKQNVFDDFIAAAEWLIAQGYTNPQRLAISGGSNGGLLVAACMIQRPQLYGAVVCQVPVIDMLRYHRFTVGRYWVPEYGNAENSPEEFGYLHAYSPLHTVPPDFANPPVLVTSADTDDRVAPLHAKKFVATVQQKSTGAEPIFLRIETRAGHGGGKPTAKRIEEAADIYTFLFRTLDMP
ncbi:MAG: S9 family peptidase [Sedimentisphaerales bacterium]|nr:S9 family peptidase [Sedimentisphaerales bacterium]